jgi:hypothetical protein
MYNSRKSFLLYICSWKKLLVNGKGTFFWHTIERDSEVTRIMCLYHWLSATSTTTATNNNNNQTFLSFPFHSKQYEILLRFRWEHLYDRKLGLMRNLLLTYSMEQSPSWEANWFAASQEIPGVLWNLKVPHRAHKRPAPIPILRQPNFTPDVLTALRRTQCLGEV